MGLNAARRSPLFSPLRVLPPRRVEVVSTPRPEAKVGLGPAPRELPRHWTVNATGDPSMFGLSQGTTTRAVSAVMLGVTGAAGLFAPAAHAQEIVTTPDVPVDLSLARAAADIEERRDTMTATELAEARRELYSAYVDSTTVTTDRTRGERRVERLMADIERRMEITAYDMAHPGSYTPLEGRPGYKQIDPDELGRLFREAVADIPLGELPGGGQLAQLVRALPNADHLDAEHMSFNELKSAVGASNREALREYFGPFLQKHKRELAISAFAGVTAARAASPEAARLLDRVLPRIEVWEGRSSDGRYSGDASLRYRDGRILPDVDLTATATRRVGVVDLRATATGTAAISRDQPLTGTVGVGARVTGEDGWLDLDARINHTRRSTVTFSGVLDVPESSLVGRGSITGTFGEGVARGNAGGRVELETSLDKRLDLGRNVDGSIGVYGAYGVDTDGRHDDARAGLVFRLRW